MSKDNKGSGKSGQSNKAYASTTVHIEAPKKDREEIEKCTRPQHLGKAPSTAGS